MSPDRVPELTRKKTGAPSRSTKHELAHPAAVLVSYADMAYSDEWGYWRGTLAGDIPGQAEFREQPRNFEKDGIEYYFEDFVITTRNGELRGTKNGVYDLKTGEFWDHGRVTEASKSWSHLIGYLVFERARTTTPGVFPMIGHRTPLVLVPPHPASGHDERTLISRADSVSRDEGQSWHGTLTGDLRGELEFRERARSYRIGDTGYFSETWTITTREGILRGTDSGEWNPSKGSFWACGTVTETSGSRDVLRGAIALMWGKASRPPGGPGRARQAPFIVVPVRSD